MTRLKVLVFCCSVPLMGWLLVTMASVAAEPDSSEKGKRTPLLVAKGASFEITLDDFLDIARSQSPTALEELKNSEVKQEQLLEKLINMNLLAAEAKRRGYDKNPEVITVKKNRLATLMHTRIADSIKEVTPTEAELRAFYEANYAKYNKPEKIRARHILLSNRKKAQELLNRMKKENIGQYQFRKYARDISEDKKTADRGGDLEFFTQNDTDAGVDPKLIEAAYQIKANGELYPQLIETRAGYHILMRTGHRQAIDLQFEDAKDRITKIVQRNLHREKIDHAMAELQKKYPVALYEENLKHVVIDLTKSASSPTASMAEKRGVR